MAGRCTICSIRSRRRRLKNFKPQVKRILDIAPLIPEIRPGWMGAVQAYGTARSLRANFKAFPVMGKTGTCSNNGTRFGWFAAYADTPTGRIVTVIFLQGGRPTFGPKAAELTGQFYRAMYERSYFQPRGVPLTPLEPATPAPKNTVRMTARWIAAAGGTCGSIQIFRVI